MNQFLIHLKHAFLKVIKGKKIFGLLNILAAY